MKSDVREIPPAAWALLALALLPGCVARDCLTITSTGRFADTPAGPCAVLHVTARPAGASRSTGIVWGVADAPNAGEQFAEIAAHAAAEDGGMTVILPFEVAELLERAELEPTLQPGPEQLRQFVQSLGLSSYMTAHVKSWRQRYSFFFSAAEIEFRLACHRADTGQAVWEAQVRKQARWTGTRELARLALYETFEWLKEGRRSDESCPPTANSK